MPSESVSVTPMAAWSLQGSSVIALQVRNRSAVKVILDPRSLQGQFTTATFQHRWLGRAGTPEDTTVLYLVTTGRPESAFIAEQRLPESEGKESKRSNLTRLTSSIGVGLKQAEALPGFDAMKQALPMIQALLLMMIITVIPALMMFSAYDPKTIFTISFALFALQFITFWWELAGWLDDRLITILYDNMAEQGIANSSVPFAAFFSSTADGWIMNLVLGMMYLVFPMFWVGMLSWAGAQLGSMASMISNSAKMPMQAGSEAGKQAQGIAIDAASGGIKGGIKKA